MAKRLGQFSGDTFLPEESNENNYDYNSNEFYEKPYENDYPTRERMGTTKRIWAVFRPLVIFTISLCIIIFGIRYLLNISFEKYFDPVDIYDSSTIEITVPKGASLSKISQILYDNNLVRNKTAFKFYADFTDMGSRLKSGTYQLSKNMSFDDIIYVLRKGMNASPTTNAKLLEGLTAENFADILKQNDVLEKTEEYLRLCKTANGVPIANDVLKSVISEDNSAKQKRKYVLEGYLFPDTYEFYRNANPTDVIAKQLARFNEIYNESYWEREDELGMTTDEIVALASIIEKEAQEHDFKKVSAVLHNRLKQGIPLQCDSTVSYDLNIKDRINLTQKELEFESPYNTYTNVGLPIGPIGNPGRAAIEAALYPDEKYIEEDYLYFTLTNPNPDADGKLYLQFSKTIEEHDAIVNKYRPMWEAYDKEKQSAAS